VTGVLSRSAKAAYFAVAGTLMRANAARHRLLGTPRRTPLRVHLGPGQRNYIDGWVNVDANVFTARCDVWADLRRRLPFRDGAVDALYSHHVIEHLPDLRAHFADAFRCLRSGGLYRVAGPNGDVAIARFVAGDACWFPDYPERRRSVGGRLENFVFCRGEHLTLLTRSYLEELLADAGFVGTQSHLPVRETGAPDVFGPCLGFEVEDDFESPHTIVLEARKP
jgi:predicted SAM-dependent methyltransferase